MGCYAVQLYMFPLYSLVAVTHHLNSCQASCLSWLNNGRKKGMHGVLALSAVSPVQRKKWEKWMRKMQN